MKLSKYVLIFLVSTCKVYALSTPAPAYELTTPGGIIAHISADKATRYVGAGTPLYNGCELNVRVSQGGKDDPVLLGVNFHDTCMHGLVEKSVSDAVDNSARITDAKIAVATAALNAKIDQLQQQLQEALSKKIDETVTAKLTDSSSTLVSTAVSGKLQQAAGETTVLGQAVLDAMKIVNERYSKNLDIQGRPLPANQYRVINLKREHLQDKEYLTAQLSGQYVCSGLPTDTIYLELGKNYTNLTASDLFVSLAAHVPVEINPNNKQEVSSNVPVSADDSRECKLITTSLG